MLSEVRCTTQEKLGTLWAAVLVASHIMLMYANGLCILDEEGHHVEMRYLLWATKDTVRSPQCIRGEQMRWIRFRNSVRPRSYSSPWLGKWIEKVLDCFSEQKSIFWIDVLITKFWILGKLAVVLFPGMFVTERAYSELPQNCHFGGYEDDTNRIAASTESPVETYARSVRKEKSDSPGTNWFEDAYRNVFEALDELQAVKRKRYQKVPVGSCQVQAFRVHIMHIVSNMVLDSSLFKTGRQNLLCQWFCKKWERYHDLKV